MRFDLATAASIGHMADMAKEMLDSVAGFKLPTSETVGQAPVKAAAEVIEPKETDDGPKHKAAAPATLAKEESPFEEDLDIDPELGELAEMDPDEAVTIDGDLLASEEDIDDIDDSDHQGRNVSAA